MSCACSTAGLYPRSDTQRKTATTLLSKIQILRMTEVFISTEVGSISILIVFFRSWRHNLILNYVLSHSSANRVFWLTLGAAYSLFRTTVWQIQPLAAENQQQSKHTWGLQMHWQQLLQLAANSLLFTARQEWSSLEKRKQVLMEARGFSKEVLEGFWCEKKHGW